MNKIEIVATILGGLELILRAIPTKRPNSPIALILRGLTALSNFFDNSKKPD